jgi:hypothetical protein
MYPEKVCDEEIASILTNNLALKGWRHKTATKEQAETPSPLDLIIKKIRITTPKARIIEVLPLGLSLDHTLIWLCATKKPLDTICTEDNAQSSPQPFEFFR